MTGKIAKIYIMLTILVPCIAIFLLISNSDVPTEGVEAQSLTEDEMAAEESGQRKWQKKELSLLENVIQIRLPQGNTQENVTIENLYMQKKLRLTITTPDQGEAADSAFYETYPILENAELEQTEILSEAGVTVITLDMSSIYEWDSTFEKQKDGTGLLTLSLMRPRDKYDRILVLDAGHGGEDCGITSVSTEEAENPTVQEKEIALDIAQKAGALLEEEQVKVYYTRVGDENPTQEERVGLANELQADMLVSIHADYADDTSVYGIQTIYNDTFFIPDFGSADLGYILLEKVAAGTNEKALGIVADMGQTYLLQNATVPVTQLNVGYLSNMQEVKLLGRADYLQRIAQGICDGILAAYDME